MTQEVVKLDKFLKLEISYVFEPYFRKRLKSFSNLTILEWNEILTILNTITGIDLITDEHELLYPDIIKADSLQAFYTALNNINENEAI